uniref:SPX domain-containing protein n=1 Tax=Kalanchoe fedtschenkoi TaxID=63787 RepID=A0A7N0RE50_KALFE
MKFGKELTIHLNETLPDWKDKYLCYKPLKKLLKAYSTSATSAPHPVNDANAGGDRLVDLQAWFVRILNEELEKFNDFYVDKEEEFVIRFQELKEHIEKVKEKNMKGDTFTSESEFSEEMMDIRKHFVTIHGEMVLLKNYSSLNFAGLNKILKKYDKRTGGLLRLQFTQLALHQPFFTTEPLTRLVRECEANLELLFPVEPEVVESTSTPPATTSQEPHNTTSASASSQKPSTVDQETNKLQQSTLSAIRTLQGLRKASSTYDPLSLSSLNRNTPDGSAGSVIVENSDTTTSSTSNENNDGADQEEVRSPYRLISPSLTP